jgi:hypothetical protein
MKLSMLRELPTSREMIDVFGGYNHNLRISEGEFYDMKNLTSSDYPVLSTRPLRGIYAPNIADVNYPPADVVKVSNPQGLIAKDGLCYVDGSDIVIGGYKIDLGLSTESYMCPKTLVSMGAYIIIMPDKKYINTANYGDKGNIEATFDSTAGNNIDFTLCKIDGSFYDYMSSSTPLNDPQDGEMWLDTSEKPYTLKQYSATNAEWFSIATTYVRITFSHLAGGLPFNTGDGITISGITQKELADFNTTMVIKDVGENYIVVVGIIDMPYRIADAIHITRHMPEMDFVIESGNRLW